MCVVKYVFVSQQMLADEYNRITKGEQIIDLICTPV